MTYEQYLEKKNKRDELLQKRLQSLYDEIAEIQRLAQKEDVDDFNLYTDELRKQDEIKVKEHLEKLKKEEKGSEVPVLPETVTSTVDLLTITKRYRRDELIKIATDLGVYNKSLNTEVKLVEAILIKKPDFK